MLDGRVRCSMISSYSTLARLAARITSTVGHVCAGGDSEPVGTDHLPATSTISDASSYRRDDPCRRHPIPHRCRLSPSPANGKLGSSSLAGEDLRAYAKRWGGRNPRGSYRASTGRPPTAPTAKMWSSLLTSLIVALSDSSTFLKSCHTGLVVSRQYTV